LIFFFSVTMVLPMGLWRLATHTVDLPEGFVYNLLGVPTSGIVNLLGGNSYAHGIWITFQMTSGQMESLGISTGCAGLESLFLFISGFIAFVLVENTKLDRRLSAALVIGILTAYLANLLRMTIIVEAGINYGRDAMLAVHENAGTLIFLGWIAIFWLLMYKFVLRRQPDAMEEAGAANSGDTLNCEGCGQQIDPDNVPDKCPSCGQKFGEGLFCEGCGKEVDPEAMPDRCPGCGNPFASEKTGEPGH
jgi:exosortase/archaeosortase family protein